MLLTAALSGFAAFTAGQGARLEPLLAQTAITETALPFSAEALTADVPGKHAIHVERAPDGLFYLDTHVNDVPVRFLVDTGATTSVLTHHDARRAKVRILVHGGVSVTTAGGRSAASRATISRLALNNGYRTADVDAIVTAEALPASLLGQDCLSRLGTVTIAGDHLTIS